MGRMSPQPLPVALRAAATIRVSRFLGRSKRVFEYDAKYAGGRVELNVDADAVLQGAWFPADAHATRQAAEAASPDVGTGPWVEYASGRPVEDTEDDPPHSHREPGPATSEPPDAPETLGQALWNNPKLVLLEVGRAIFELAYGRHLILEGESILLRLLGLALFVFGLIHVASYVLKFFPRVLQHERWSRTWPRRAVRAVLKYAWVAAGVGWLVAQYVWGR